MASLDKREKGYYRFCWYEDGKLKSMRFKPGSFKDALDVKRQEEEEPQRAKSTRTGRWFSAKRCG